MPRYRLTIEYAGTRYSGWQIQKNAKTVQGELHRAPQETLGKTPFETYGSGRTGAGVHALGRVAHVDTAATLPPKTGSVIPQGCPSQQMSPPARPTPFSPGLCHK